MCRGSSLLNGVTPIVPPVRLSPHPRTKLLDGDWPPVVRRPRPSGARPAYRQAPSGRIRFSARGVAARAGEKLLTTNYDLLVEYALGTKEMNYGMRGEVLTGRGPYPVSQWANPVTLTGSVSVAKMHGSVSWDENARYTDGRRGLTGDALIIAPTPEKSMPDSLRDVWDLAARILGRAPQRPSTSP